VGLGDDIQRNEISDPKNNKREANEVEEGGDMKIKRKQRALWRKSM
jgi:hypothetical protein